MPVLEKKGTTAVNSTIWSLCGARQKHKNSLRPSPNVPPYQFTDLNANNSVRAQNCPTVKSESVWWSSWELYKPCMHALHRSAMLQVLLEGITHNSESSNVKNQYDGGGVGRKKVTVAGSLSYKGMISQNAVPFFIKNTEPWHPLFSTFPYCFSLDENISSVWCKIYFLYFLTEPFFFT